MRFSTAFEAVPVISMRVRVAEGTRSTYDVVVMVGGSEVFDDLAEVLQVGIVAELARTCICLRHPEWKVEDEFC